MSDETIPPALVAEGARPKLGSDSNGNQVEDTSVSLEESFESGFDDGLIGSSRGTGTGSVSGSTIGSPSLASLDEPAALAEPTEEERLAWQQEMLKIEEETATLRLVLQVRRFCHMSASPDDTKTTLTLMINNECCFHRQKFVAQQT